MGTEIQGRAAHVAAIRERAEAEMKAMGIDEAFIDRLVETFYGAACCSIRRLDRCSTPGFPAVGPSICRR
ncbi:hypothetical protein EV291_10729 [Rhizobium sp. BK068]|nr:hypothetical protein EV291_10729 [Rhizobium sp. BK068]